jgi:chorismate dehydratase
VTTTPHSLVRIAAIRFLNPAPLMWDFTHPPLSVSLALHYKLDWMLPSACADALADGSSDLGLVPIAALATNPTLQPLPGSTIASKHHVRSLILVHHANQSLNQIRTIAADTASRATLAYTQILFRLRGNRQADFLPAVADLDRMLELADAALLIGDAALLALEEEANRRERTGEELVYLDLAALWRAQTGLAWVSAIWAAAPGLTVTNELLADLDNSRIHGLANIDTLVQEWSGKLPLAEKTIRTYLTKNIHYTLDAECLEAIHGFFSLAAETGVLPDYRFQTR